VKNTDNVYYSKNYLNEINKKSSSPQNNKKEENVTLEKVSNLEENNKPKSSPQKPRRKKIC